MTTGVRHKHAVELSYYLITVAKLKFCENCYIYITPVSYFHSYCNILQHRIQNNVIKNQIHYSL